MWVRDRSSDYNPESPGLSGWVSNVNKGPYKEAAGRETWGHMELKQGAADALEVEGDATGRGMWL